MPTIVTEIFYAGAWHDISADVRNRDPGTIERGADDESSRVQPGSLSFTLNNGRSEVSGAVGRYTPRNPRSDLFELIGRNTPVRQTVDGHRRFTGEISEWPTRWGLAGTDVWVNVKAYGILRRLGQGGGKPVRSPLRRRLELVGADAYWPLDTGDPTAFGAPVFGADQLRVTSSTDGFALGTVDLAPWAGSGITLGTGGSLDPAVSPTVQAALEGGVTMTPPDNVGAPGDSYEWTVEFLQRYPEGPAPLGTGFDAENTVDLRLQLYGADASAFNWEIWTSTDSGQVWFHVAQYATDFPAVPGTGALDPWAFHPPYHADGQLHHVRLFVRYSWLNVTQITVTWNLAVDGIFHEPEQSFISTLPKQGINRMKIAYLGRSPKPPLVAFGHLAIRHAVAAVVSGTADAGTGHLGEPAGRRIERLCAEDGIPFQAVGDLDDTEPLGPQYPASLLDLLDESAATDGGILYESRTEAGLVYATRRGLYNRPAALALDYAGSAAQGGHVSTIEPVDDDQAITNDATAKRPDGGQRQAVKLTGPLSVLPPPAGVGRYDREVTRNVPDDDRLTRHAEAIVNIGTIDETRFPEIGLRAIKFPELIADAVALDSGSVLTVDNPPAWLPPGQIRGVVTGYRESYSIEDWEIAWHTVPAEPYRVGVLDVDRLGTDRATVAATFVAGTDTALSVAWTGTPIATVGATDFEIRAAGVVLHVTNIAGAASPQTFTVDATPVNGVAKTIPAGAAVQLAYPWRLAF